MDNFKLPNLPLTPDQVMAFYLEIQTRLGVLVDQAPQPSKEMFRKASMDLLKAKREWIGDVGELTGDNIAQHGRKVSVAVERRRK